VEPAVFALGHVDQPEAEEACGDEEDCHVEHGGGCGGGGSAYGGVGG